MAVSSIAGSLIKPSLAAQASTQALAERPVNGRTEQPLDSAPVKLSAAGQIKSAVAAVETAGQALADVENTAAPEDVRKATIGFVRAFNQANKTITAATQRETGTAADNNAPAPLAEGGALDELSKIGITQQSDGSLALDSKLFDRALQAQPEQVRGALAGAGEQVAHTATRELAGNGQAGASPREPERAPGPESRQNAQQEEAAAAQRLAEQRQALVNNHPVAGNLAAYQRTLSA